MAEKVIEKLDEQLNCSICLDTYTDPSASIPTEQSASYHWSEVGRDNN